MHTDSKPHSIDGGLYVDNRGTVSFVNNFDFKGVDRFYTIRGHRPNEPRGWIGHRREQKWFHVIHGTVRIAVVKPDNWDLPTKNLPVEYFLLSATKPQLLYIPMAYATGCNFLSVDSILLIFSSGKIESAKIDEYRFPVNMWEINPIEDPLDSEK